MTNLPANCEIFVTRDGSPTLMWTNSEGYAEKMHHAGGALSESIFIYHSALTQALDRAWPARVLSLGLGLGYNEILAAAEILKRGAAGWKIWSFESQEPLRVAFEKWLERSDGPLPTLYEQVLRLVAEKFRIVPEDLKKFLREAVQSRRLEVRGSFPEHAGDLKDVTCVFYDAYSKKMNPELWDESSIAATLGPMLAQSALLTTYAATGSLNRALKSLGFRPTKRPGFEGKRESTLAIRE